ncbi:MAG: FecR domain-containing protein [Anaerolineae bacterium]|nr:FecR domain-containing protein [Anaerolineae bacterium]
MMNEEFLRNTFAKQTQAEAPSGRALNVAREAMRNVLRETRATHPVVGALQEMVYDVNRVLSRFGDFIQGPTPEPEEPEIKLSPFAYAKARILSAGAIIRRGKVDYRVREGYLAATHAGDEIITEQGQLNLTPFAHQDVLIASGAHAKIEAVAQTQGNTQFDLRIVLGRAVSSITKSLGQDDLFLVRMPTAQVQAHGTEFVADVISPTDSYVAVTEGVVAVKMGEQEISLPAGMELHAVEGEKLEAQAIPDFSPGEVYLAKAGDTFAGLIRQFNVNSYRMSKANPHITDPNSLLPGTMLLIPKSQLN